MTELAWEKGTNGRPQRVGTVGFDFDAIDGRPQEPEPRAVPPENSLAQLAWRFLGVVMAGKTLLERDRRLHCLVFVFAPGLSRYSTAADLARGLGMSKATGWRLLKKVQRETLNSKKAK